MDGAARKPFGGNVAQYLEALLSIPGVGAAAVYPAWGGGGTVLASVAGPGGEPASPGLVAQVKARMDPEGGEGEGLGLAPIGHRVTVTTPLRREVGVSMSLTLDHAQPAMAAAQVAEAIGAHFARARAQWGHDRRALSVYRANITAEAMGVPGVVNVEGLRLDGLDADLHLVDRAEPGGQELPYLGHLEIN